MSLINIHYYDILLNVTQRNDYFNQIFPTQKNRICAYARTPAFYIFHYNNKKF